VGDPIDTAAPEADSPESEARPVVGLGASAGGIDALRELLGQLPADTGMAFVVVQHLDPDRPSMLAHVLGGSTPMRVVEVTDGMRLEPDRIHVIPPASDLVVRHGVLTLVERQKTGRLHLPIDAFFRSLADDPRLLPIGVVLSGSGADGTEGLRAIKARGGICIVQEPSSAAFPSMPEHAISVGAVDFRGTPERIADELVRLSRHAYVTAGARAKRGAEPVDAEGELASILGSIREHAGVDFGGYKRSTLLRRIEKRMSLRHADALAEYARMVRDDPQEARTLAQEVLIHVTAFFRDPEAFAALEAHVFPKLVERARKTGSVRVWVPGCSTGEEAYSIGIGLLEAVGEHADDLSIQIFGTDISREAIETARASVYSEPALEGVSPERLARHFNRVEGGYRIGKRVRDLCIFVEHDLTRDPPFARLDLVSCRNVLIYFEAELQRRVIPLLHYCLNERGYLFLGRSEALTGFRDLFAPVDKASRIFVKTGPSRALVYPMPTSRQAEVKLSEGALAERRHPAREAQRQVDHLLLARYAPPGVVVDDRLEIVQFRGRTGPYLESPPGQPQTNLLRMVREGLAAHVHEALDRAKAASTTVRKDRLELQAGGETLRVSIEVVPLTSMAGSDRRYFLVLFEEGTRASTGIAQRPTGAEPTPEIDAEVERLRAELGTTKDYLQSLISDHQMTTDDLAATNEELVAANEELQSTNEELQSAKEELQSANEELSTLNDQLRSRNQELDQVANDLANVLASVDIPIIIVDLELRIRRYTPTLDSVASFIAEDVGRPIKDLRLRVDIPDLVGCIRGVIETLSPREWQVRGEDGRWFRMQIRPYRTADRRLDGAVLSFVDIDVLERARQDAEEARDYARAIVDTVATPLVVLDSSLRVVSTNRAFEKAFLRQGETVEHACIFELGERIWDVAELRHALQRTLAERVPFTDLELTVDLPGRGRRIYASTGRPISWSGHAAMLLLAIHDVTLLRALEAERIQLLASEKQARLEAERATRAKDVFLAILSHELRTPLSSILMSAQLLESLAPDDPRVARASAAIERAAHTQARLIEDLLDISRIVSGKLLLNLGPVELAEVVNDAIDQAQPSAGAKGLTLEAVITRPVGVVYGDPARLQQVVGNLLNNAIKFTPRGGRVDVRLEQLEEHAVLTVRDTGMGIPAEVLPRLFSTFIQADSSVTRTHGGLGLGLAIVRHLVDAHGGQIEAQSAGPGKGATFRVALPVGVEAARKPTEGPQAVARSIRGVRVLLVEDDDDTREAYAAMLDRLGADVRAVPSAAQGMAALEELRPDVILSDIAMPGEDGYAFIQRVRARGAEHGGDVPAAAVTALAADEDRRRALEAGFQLHVAKPVDAMKLAAVVSELIGSHPRSDA
jgi:two-component system, chemotaxis family, CheB/CheR fusion protein